MGEYRNRDCMFCGQELVANPHEHPVHLAFIDHIAKKAACQAQHRAYQANMLADFKGD